MNHQTKANSSSQPFSQITQDDERDQVWAQLKSSQAPVKVYPEETQGSEWRLRLHLSAMERGHLVFTAVPSGVELRSGSFYHLTFALRELRYFARFSDFKQQDHQLILAKPTPLYAVNRRVNFRVQIPQGLRLRVDVEGLNHRAVDLPHQLSDLSIGGCCLFTPAGQAKLAPGDHLQLRLNLLTGRAPVKMSGRVRYLRPAHPPNTSSGWLIGIQFETAGLSGDLFTLVLSLYRRAQTYAKL